MSDRNKKTIPRYLAIGLALLATSAEAQDADSNVRLPMSFFAETTSYDGKTSTFIFTGLVLSQGSINIQADEGRAKRLAPEDNATWQLSNNIVINVENGHIECDSADLEFDEFELKTAVVIGSPATFRLTQPGSDDVTYAEAGKLAYSVETGIIEFSDRVTFTQGGNEIASNFLVYNIPEQTFSADSSGVDGDRVRITYTPATGSEGNTEEEDENP